MWQINLLNHLAVDAHGSRPKSEATPSRRGFKIGFVPISISVFYQNFASISISYMKKIQNVASISIFLPELLSFFLPQEKRQLPDTENVKAM